MATLAAALLALATAGLSAGESPPAPAAPPARLASEGDAPPARPPAPVAELQKALRKHIKRKSGRGRPFYIEDLEAETRWALRLRRFAKAPIRELPGGRYIVRVEFQQEEGEEEGLLPADVTVDFTLARGGSDGWKVDEEAVAVVDGEKRFNYDTQGRRIEAP